VPDALTFLLLVEAIGLIGLPFAAALFSRLPGGGLALARPLGLLLVAYPVWLLASLHAIRYTRTAAVAATAVAAVVAVALGRVTVDRIRRGSAARRLWVAGEILFVTCFGIWALVRSFAPEIVQTEKPMDMAIVNSVNASASFPPHDPWFAGAQLNYYYFGHYVAAFLIRLVGVDPAVGYNLAVALFFALTATAVFAVASALYLALGPKGGSSPRSALLPGLAAAGLAMAGNLAGAVQYLHHPERFAGYDWFAPSRVIPHTANEFPFFSFLLGDLHAHVLAVPFALTALAFSMQVCLSGPRLGGRRAASRLAALGELALGALLLGALYALNSLDYPTAIALAALALVTWVLQHPATWLRSLCWGALWLAGSVLLFLPYWRDFSPTTHGIGLVHERTNFSTFLKDEFLIYGLSLWVVATILLRRRGVPVRYVVWGAIAVATGLVLLSPSRLASVLVGLAAGAAALYVALSGERPQAERFLWLLIAAALALIGVGEFAYVRDAFDGTPSFRFNTVFKAGYQAWFLLSIAAGCIAFWNRGWLGAHTRRVWQVGLACLALLSFAYPVVGTYSRSRGFDHSPTLDGMSWLDRTAPADAAAIRWLRRREPRPVTVLEALGPDFDPAGTARVSTFTGLPTVLGWAGHEIQWGHLPGTRPVDVDRIFGTPSASVAKRLLASYGVRYVFVGSLERRRYPAIGLRKFADLGKPVFARGRTIVYRLPAAAPTPPARSAAFGSIPARARTAR
jgi:YYY domain-containing protein